MFGFPSYSWSIKIDSRARPCLFLGYPYTTKGYRLYDLNSHTVFLSPDVFFKRFFFFNHWHLLLPRLLLLIVLQQSHLCLFIIITTLLILHLSQIQCPLLPLHYLQFQLTPFLCQPHLIEGLPEHANSLPIFKTSSATLPTKGLLNQAHSHQFLLVQPLE